jgi:hypothetical protein
MLDMALRPALIWKYVSNDIVGCPNSRASLCGANYLPWLQKDKMGHSKKRIKWGRGNPGALEVGKSYAGHFKEFKFYCIGISDFLFLG